MFEGFTLEQVHTGEATLRVRHGGSGPPLLLLHGHPQTHVMWHRVAPRLTDAFTVICPDLRGFGGSSKPPTMPDHEPHSVRAMARDLAGLMNHFGFDTFAVAGHDRGGHTAFRLAMDYPERVTKLATLEATPIVEVWQRMDRELALSWWHWLFFAQPYPLPERLLRASPEGYYFREGREKFHPEALAEYLHHVRNPNTIHAMVEHYRANATFDYELERAEQGRKRLACPVLALWSTQEEFSTRFDPLAIWRGWADDVQGHGVDCGHFLAEEAPDEVYVALREFFAGKMMPVRHGVY